MSRIFQSLFTTTSIHMTKHVRITLAKCGWTRKKKLLGRIKWPHIKCSTQAAHPLYSSFNMTNSRKKTSYNIHLAGVKSCVFCFILVIKNGQKIVPTDMCHVFIPFLQRNRAPGPFYVACGVGSDPLRCFKLHGRREAIRRKKMIEKAIYSAGW